MRHSLQIATVIIGLAICGMSAAFAQTPSAEGLELFETNGAFQRLACERGGRVWGTSASRTIAEAGFAGGEIISVREYRTFAEDGELYIYFAKDGIAWPQDGFGVLAHTWRFECR